MVIEDKIVGGKISLGKTGLYLQAQTQAGRIIQFNFVQLPELRTIGISNICEDQEAVLFLDYDDISLVDLKKQMLYFFKHYDISHFFVLETGENRYHMISFEKFPLSLLQEIMDNSLCDSTYKKMPRKLDKGWILRLMPKIDADGKVLKKKPEFLVFEWFGEPKRKLSRAHIELFSKLYPGVAKWIDKTPSLAEKYWDDYNTVNLIKYGTSNKNIITDLDADDFINSRKLVIKWSEESGEDKNAKQ